MPAVISALTTFFDFILLPLGAKTSVPGLLIGSVISALLVLWAYRFFSRPERTRTIKNRIKANILSLRLYRDFPASILSSLAGSLGGTVKYFAWNLLPIAISLPLLVLIFVQMDVRFGRRPFQRGEETVVLVRFSEDVRAGSWSLDSGKNWRQTIPPVRIPVLHELNWRIQARNRGKTLLSFIGDGYSVKKEIEAGNHFVALRGRRSRLFSIRDFIDPPETMLPDDGPVVSISFSYPRRSLHFGPLSLSWIYFYLGIMIVVIVVLKNRFGVEF